jgi:hypothetical protein
LAQVVRPLQVKVSRSNLFDVLCLLGIQFSGLADKEPGGAGGRQAAGNTAFGRQIRRKFDRQRGSIECQG